MFVSDKCRYMEVLESYYEAIIQDLRQGEDFAKLVNEKYLEEHKQLGKSNTFSYFYPHLTQHTHRFIAIHHHRIPIVYIAYSFTSLHFHFVNVVLVVICGRQSLIDR